MNEKEQKAANIFLGYITDSVYKTETHQAYAKAYKDLMKAVRLRIEIEKLEN